MQILPQHSYRCCTCMLVCFNKRTPSPSHTLLHSLSVTDVYTLISNCASTCALQKFFALTHDHKHIEDTISHHVATKRCIYSFTPTHSHFSTTSTETHFTINRIAPCRAVTCSYMPDIHRTTPRCTIVTFALNVGTKIDLYRLWKYV